MFVAISNHPVAKWSKAQLEAAEELGGQISSIQFPNIPTSMTTTECMKLGAEVAEQATSMVPYGERKVAMVAGEFVTVFAIVTELQAHGFLCVSAVSERKVVEKVLENGSTEKTVVFEFAGFRAYPEY